MRRGRPKKWSGWSKHIKIHVPIEHADIIKEIDKRAQEEDTSRNDIILSLLREALGLPRIEAKERYDNGEKDIRTEAKAILMKEQIMEKSKSYETLVSEVSAMNIANTYELANKMNEINALRRDILDKISKYPYPNDPDIREIFNKVRELPREIQEVYSRWKVSGELTL